MQEHSEFRSCTCHYRRNKQVEEQIAALAGRADNEAVEEYNSLWPKLFYCNCTLLPSEIAHAIAIQAAVEVALQRAGGEISVAALIDDNEEIPGGYHSCNGPCCEKRPGEYCADDDCNCGAAGNHATLPKP